jgi:hypothetical protein
MLEEPLRHEVTDLFTPSGMPFTWEQCRSFVLRRDGRICYLCGERANEVDHVIPRRWGGLDMQANLRAICGPCNKVKSDSIDLGKVTHEDLRNAAAYAARRAAAEVERMLIVLDEVIRRSDPAAIPTPDEMLFHFPFEELYVVVERAKRMARPRFPEEASA